jgi:hypothetical protein
MGMASSSCAPHQNLQCSSGIGRGPITSIAVSWVTGVQNDVEMKMANATMKGLDQRGLRARFGEQSARG